MRLLKRTLGWHTDYARQALRTIPVLVGAATVAVSLLQFSHVIHSNTDSNEGAVTPLPASNNAINIASITQLHWFGVAPSPQDNAAPNPANALIELRGVSASGQAKLIGAYIAEKGKPEAYFRIGDTLPANAGTLAEVHADHIVIRNGQTTTTLPFTPPDGSTTPTNSPASGIVYR